MIDTIVIKLHHVSKYPLTKTKYESKSKTTISTLEVDETETKFKNNSKISALMYHDNDTIIPLTKRDSVFIPSSHYLLSYFYQVRHDSIEFNFSIPKYLWGTNVLQFVKYSSQDITDVWLLFQDFINQFLLKQFPDKIDLNDLELCRFDMCYNQFFPSKMDALRYMDAQEQLIVKYARSSINRVRHYKGEGFEYVTDRYKFKVYHKGTEFSKHDKKKLAKNNPKGFNISDLQDKADMILRYEVTYRRSQINYLFKQFKLHNNYMGFDTDSEDAHQWQRVLNPSYYRYSLDYIDRSKTFLMSTANHDPVINLTATFDIKVFSLCWNFFWDYVKKFQLHPKLSIHDVQRNIDQINDSILFKNKIRSKQQQTKEKSRLTMLALLAQEYPLEEIRKMGIIPKTTYYRYQKELKQIGVISENRLPITIIPPKLDFQEYKYYFGRYHFT